VNFHSATAGPDLGDVTRRDHPVEAIDVQVALLTVVRERDAPVLEREDGILDHRSDDQVHSTPALFRAEFGGV
jgi:hypothetical protein